MVSTWAQEIVSYQSSPGSESHLGSLSKGYPAELKSRVPTNVIELKIADSKLGTLK